jgi:agmatine deiminase
VLEGGSIDVDEFGTLLTTSECLLTSKRARYGKWGLEVCERILSEALGIKKVLWLESGIAGDDTSGHIDDFARFAPGGKVLVASEVNRKDPNYAPLERARRALEKSTNARGKRLDVIPLPMPKPVYYRGERLPASYANFYIGNAAVLVPVFNDPSDQRALDLISAAFPDRPTVGIYARDLVVGLGTLHCSTMQEPQ